MNDIVLERGREAASRGDWCTAFRLLQDADSVHALGAEDLALLANVSYAAGHLDETIESWERAHAEYIRSGNRLAAAGAATRVAMHLLFDTAMMAPVRGWTKKAERLLVNEEGTPVHAWLAVVHNYERMFSGEFEEARRWARRAIELGTQCEPSAAAMGRIAEARSLVFEGHVQRGLELLNEAAMAAVSGELDPIWTGVVYCEVVCALQALAQYDLAEEWTQAMERWRHGQPVGSIHGRCRVHRAEILRLRGANTEAEAEALRACDELRPYLRREFGWPVTELGRIRLRKGDLAGAEEAFLVAQQAGWDPQPGLALTYLARGDATLAAASIRHALDHPSRTPSKELPPNTELRRAPLLEAQVEIALEIGDVERARWAAEELEKIAATFGSNALAASAASASGRVRLAEGDAEGARHEFERAMFVWSEIGAPYETALARMGIAESHQASGNAACALMEFQAARAAFEEVGATLLADRAARACVASTRDDDDDRKPDSAIAPRTESGQRDSASSRAGSVFQREGEYWSVTFDGRTTRFRDMKGLRYLARLLAEPGREVHVLDLVSAERGWAMDMNEPADSRSSTSDTAIPGPILDARAKEAFRRRLAEIDEEIELADAAGDVDRAAQADAERACIIRELSRAIGFGGRDRPVSSASERARVSVSRALRLALDRIGTHDPHLYEHLDHCVRTGTFCVYAPDPTAPVTWTV